MAFRTNASGGSDNEPGMNLTPMIDVLFLLIIFFVFASKFRDDDGRLKVNLPGLADLRTAGQTPDEKIVYIYRSGQLQLDKQPVSGDQLRALLQQQVAQYPRLQVAIHGDRDVTLEQFAQVTQAITAAGVRQVNLAHKLR
jgi:biopolymer transport protein ExbD